MADANEANKEIIFFGNHGSTLLVELNKERIEEDSFCDVTLCVDEQQFHGHRCVIAKFSTMLHKMFKTEMKEKYDTDVNLEGLNASTMQLVMGYIYTARVKITTANAITLISASDYLQIDALKKHCVDFFEQSISPLNMLGIQKAANMHNESSLATSSATFLSLNKESIVQQPEFNDFTPNEVQSLLFVEEERPEREELAYKSIVRWVKHDVEQRQDEFPGLLKNVKLHLLSTVFLEEVVEKEPLIHRSDVCKDYFATELLKRLRLSPAIKAPGDKATMKFVFFNEKIIQLVDVRSLEITRLPDLPCLCRRACVAASHKKLFVIGCGNDEKCILDLRLDQDSNWRIVGKTREGLSFSKALYHKGRVLVAGGSDYRGWNTSVEWFDPRPKQVVCSSATAMSLARRNHCFVKHRDYLVCAGPDNSIEFYGSDSKTWSAGVSLDDDNVKITAAVSCGDFYVFDATGWLNRLHPLTGKWKKIIFVDAHVVSALADGETIHSLISSTIGCDVWSYNTKTGDQKRRHVEAPCTLGTCYGGIVY